MGELKTYQLNRLIEAIGEKEVEKYFADFSCPKDKDLESIFFSFFSPHPTNNKVNINAKLNILFILSPLFPFYISQY